MNKKGLKRIFSVFLSSIMILCISISASAAMLSVNRIK